MHPNREFFLGSYYRCELEPVLIYTAIAWAAVHLLLSHPETPLRNQLRMALRSLLSQAKQSLADVFDVPSSQTVLAFINMDACLHSLSRFTEAYTCYSQAALMALALQMDKDDATEKNPVHLEFRRRIWASVCKRELFYVFECDKPSLIALDTIKASSKPTMTASDSESYKFATVCFMLDIITYSKLLEFQNIDWTLPDAIIAQQLVGFAGFLQNDQTEAIQYCSEDDLSKIFPPGINFSFWSRWCALWRQFIKSDAPTGRLETILMQQMREKAFDEYVKGLIHCIASLKWAIGAQARCKSNILIGAHIICENVRFITQTHPRVSIRRLIFQELISLLDLLQSLVARGILTQWLASQIVEILEEMKPTVFSREVLQKAY
ncbi:uncharacterized protein VTP21DRAFT_5653 [Calcarisporiella thermophila]|uniref:uncharacterized protein n=1 Tax=Calcarisporiella thermophila TaxID=911321 RepID=UPI003744245E